MRLHEHLLIALVLTLAATVVAARPAAAQDGVVGDPDFINSQRLSAEVSATGALGVNTGAVSATRVGTGEYEVIFIENVRDCAYVGTIAEHAFNTVPGKTAVVGLGSDPNGVRVLTFSNFGASVNRDFHLRLACP